MMPRIALFLLLLALQSAAAGAQATAAATITFVFDNPGLQPPHFRMVLAEDGAGHYESSGIAATEASATAAPFSRDMTVADPLRRELFAVARKDQHFAAHCALDRKLAFTGDKTISYSGPDGAGSCMFNYARDHELQQAAEQLQAVANTLEEGRKLQLLLDHDKLGLDAGIEQLGKEQANGLAMDLQNLGSLLREIAANPDVLNRTRERASALLTAGPPAR